MYDYPWHNETHPWRKTVAVLLVLVITLFCGMLIGNHYAPKTTDCSDCAATASPAEAVRMRPVIYEGLDESSRPGYASIKIPAVDEENNGVTTLISVQAFPGSGRILTNIDKLLFWVDTQNSIRRATQVAENVRGINISAYDIIYTIQANASVIGGPSAGAAITMATIAAIENRTINQSVMITGTVNHDGTIGPVGGVMEKAIASKDSGAVKFLVPLTQSTEITYKTRQYCEKIGWADFCTTETYPVKVDIEKDVGIDVLEVMTIQDAMKYMLI